MSNRERSLLVTLWVMVVGGLTLGFFMESHFFDSAMWLAAALVVFIGGWAFHDEFLVKKKRR